MTKPSKFGALSRLNTNRDNPVTAPSVEPIPPATPIAAPTVDAERWEPIGTEVRQATKRRLKAYAGWSGRKVKEVVEEALTAYLDAHDQSSSR